jgi:DNA processing protein
MERSAALTWSSLHVLNKRRYDAVQKVYGSLEAALPHVGEEFLCGLGCREETVREALMRLEEFDPAQYEQELQKFAIQFLTIDDAEYPELLKQTSDPPVFLYALGDLALLKHPCVALVGTRGMSPYGRRVVGAIVPELVAAGVVTVSGLAKGIDAEVARETLHSGGKTVAVLGHGLKQIYPPCNRPLAKEILQEGGLLITECALGVPPEIHGFPARNRIIAGVSLATAVLEAPEGSGALHTAAFALEEGRDLFVVPGQIFDAHYEGCHRLLASGQAALLSKATQILEGIGVVAPAAVPADYSSDDPTERAIWEVITSLPQDMDALLERTKLSAPVLSAALTMMELKGVVTKAEQGAWVRA